jgi:hypothetical protein
MTDTAYFTIAKVETHEVQTTGDNTVAPIVNPDNYGYVSTLTGIGGLGGGLDIDGVSVDAIVNLGKEIWSIIQANKPVVNVTTNEASALPRGVTDWSALSGWDTPRIRTFETNFTNAYGINVVSFQYRLSYTSGGSYNGQGQYLSHVTVSPENVTVLWGYTFNAQVSVPNVTNAGTSSNPLAAAEVLVSWTVDTVLKHEQQSSDYYVRGDGSFEQLQ